MCNQIKYVLKTVYLSNTTISYKVAEAKASYATVQNFIFLNAKI